MAATHLAIVLLLVVTLSYFVVGQQAGIRGPVEETCLGCICEAVSNCTRGLGCERDVCGLFKITWAYWSDAGKPVIPQDNKENEKAYVQCVTEPYCAAAAVQGYMTKFRQDCNGDGIVDCYDYALIHRLGGYGCKGNVDYFYWNAFTKCMADVQQLQGK